MQDDYNKLKIWIYTCTIIICIFNSSFWKKISIHLYDGLEKYQSIHQQYLA